MSPINIFHLCISQGKERILGYNLPAMRSKRQPGLWKKYERPGSWVSSLLWTIQCGDWSPSVWKGSLYLWKLQVNGGGSLLGLKQKIKKFDEIFFGRAVPPAEDDWWGSVTDLRSFFVIFFEVKNTSTFCPVNLFKIYNHCSFLQDIFVE